MGGGARERLSLGETHAFKLWTPTHKVEMCAGVQLSPV